MNLKLRNKKWSFTGKVYWKEIIALFMLLLAIVFFRGERKELNAIIPQIEQASPLWLGIAFIVSVCSTFLQGGMYRNSFASVGLLLKWTDAVELFLKRNFLSVFLPAGGVSALAYSTSQIRKAGFTKMQIYQASGLFGFAGLLTVFIVGLPVIILLLFFNSELKNSWIGLLVLLLLILVLIAIAMSMRKNGWLHNWMSKKLPAFIPAVNELMAAKVNGRLFSGAVGYSLGVELTGILHVYLAMLALGLPASFEISAAAYIISVLMMVISPFLRGLGAVELSMVFVLEKFGYSSVNALSVTILYRVFEFWLPLLAGFIAFAWKGRKLFLRLAPALLTFALGIINIISAVTPPLHWRARLMREYIPLTAIHASTLLVLFIGLFLLLTAAFLFRGLRNAWAIALTLSVISFVGHLTKALDYEEALFAAVTCIVLITTASQYRIQSSTKWMQAGLKTAALSFAAVLLFAFISFYFIDVKHFGIDFTWKQSLVHTLKSFLLVEDTTLHPITRFGEEFIWFIRCLGFLTWGFLLFTLIKPNRWRYVDNKNNRTRALFLLHQFGSSSVDYFKTYKDKLFFLSDIHDAFVAYRISAGFAIVLDEPVCAEENKVDVLEEFDLHCRKMGLRPAFYRVDENSIPWFNRLKKQKLMIGQEAILDINSFSLEGKDKKNLRNGLNGLKKKGYTATLHAAPHHDEFIFQLKSVSDEWLQRYHKKESIFSQGMFDERELKQQDILALHDEEGKVKAFLNIIPDYAMDECTYDLIRKTDDAPGAALDALIIKLIEYARDKKKLYVNLGMVPMSGIAQPHNTAEQVLKLASEKIKRFQRYEGLKMFKEKYAALWENKYLVYDNDFDLLQLPLALNNVMKP